VGAGAPSGRKRVASATADRFQRRSRSSQVSANSPELAPAEMVATSGTGRDTVWVSTSPTGAPATTAVTAATDVAVCEKWCQRVSC
jgi:hypothetical protein